MQPQHASAGNAQERGPVENPVGLYKNPDGLFVGALDPAAADAMVQQKFVLVKAGLDAAKLSEAEIEKLTAKPTEGAR